MQSDLRKRDTRTKIELGGLVIKAGLTEVPRALILGILMDGMTATRDEAERTRLTRLGHDALQL
jgi:Conjugal transfer protein TraD